MDPSVARGSSKRNIHGQIVHELGLRILRGEFPPGSNLPNETDLSVKLGVSRTAMREAVKVLTAKGLLESRPKVGTRVRAKQSWNLLDPDVLRWYCNSFAFSRFANDLMHMRHLIEPAASALAAANRTPEQLVDLQNAYASMDAASDLDQWTSADLRFHRAILAGTGNDLMVPLGALIEAGLETLFVYSAGRTSNPRYSLPLHHSVLRAIERQDAARAKRAMLKILAATAETLSDRIAADGKVVMSRNSVDVITPLPGNRN